MQHITGTNRYQTNFSSLEDLIDPNNKVHIIDAFVEKLELDKLDFNARHKSEDPLFIQKCFLSFICTATSTVSVAAENLKQNVLETRKYAG